MTEREMIGRYRRSELAAAIARRDIVLTITSGRSGTRLLTQLCRRVLEVDSRHEPEPKANFALRPALADRALGVRWLIEEKLPAIAGYGDRQTYVETSNMYGKGFVELFFAIGVVPRFIILRYDARHVARSFYKMNAIPERSENGKIVHLGPSDANVLPLPDWETYSDYQLMYWYAKEMQRRQDRYATAFAIAGVPYLQCSIADLVDWDRFATVARFIDYDPPLAKRAAFDETIAVNQNPTSRFLNGAPDRELPEDCDAQELVLDCALARAAVR